MPFIKLLSNYFSFNSKSKNICVFRKKRAKTRKFGKHWRIIAQKCEILKITKMFRESSISGKRGRPRKSVRKLSTPPIYVFIRNLLHNVAYNPSGETLGDIQTDGERWIFCLQSSAGRTREKEVSELPGRSLWHWRPGCLGWTFQNKTPNNRINGMIKWPDVCQHQEVR